MSDQGRSERDSLLVHLAVGVAGVALIIVLASVAYLVLSDEEETPVAATPAPAATTPSRPPAEDAEPSRSPGGRPWRTFDTGTDPGEAVPATVCSMRADEVYCWTPNDGYTIVLGRQGEPRRVRADEAGNRGRVLASARRLDEGRTARRAGFSCTAEPGRLVCESPAGHGWVLPRYRGLPDLY